MFLILSSSASIALAMQAKPEIPRPVRRPNYLEVASSIDPLDNLQPDQEVEPVSDPAGWFNARELRTAAEDGDAASATKVRLLINRWGRVGDCEVLSTSGQTKFDDLACSNAISRGRFYPATDANANPLTASYEHSFTWSKDAIAPRPTVAIAPGPSVQRLPKPPVQTSRVYAPRLSDYPAAAREAKAEGVAKVALIIGNEGEISKCTISQSSGNAELDWASCTMAMDRMTFSPALNIDGQPTDGLYEQSLRWRLPPENSEVPLNIFTENRPVRMPDMGNGRAGFDLTYDKDGVVISCAAIEEGDLPKEMKLFGETCAQAKERGVEKATDKNGNPVGRTVRFQMVVETENNSD